MNHRTKYLLTISFLWICASWFNPTFAWGGVWHSERRLTDISGQSWGPRIAAFNGVVHVVWFEYPDFSDPEIFYSRSPDNGISWTLPQNLSNHPSRQDLYPSIAADAFGVYVFWSSDVMDGEAFFRRSMDGGNTWEAEQQITNANGYSRASDILVDQQGYIHLVWSDSRNGYSGIYHLQSCDRGISWNSEKWVTEFDGEVDNEDPKIVQGTDQTLYLLFRSSRDGIPQGGWPPYEEYVLRSQSNSCPAGAAWFYPAQRVSRGLPDELSNNYSGTISVGKNDRLHLAYWNERRGNNVVYRRGVPRGAGWGEPKVISSFFLNHPQSEGNNRSNPGLVEDDANGVYLFYSEHASIRDTLSIGRLFYRSSGDTGVTWNSILPLGISSLTASPQALYHQNRVHVVWIDFRDDNYGSEIYYRALNLSLQSLVDHYYTSILKRSPDPGGKGYWESEVERATSLEIDLKEAYLVMGGNFFASAEYIGMARTDPEFITDLYLTFFDREPDSEGMDFWLAQLSSGSSRDMVMYFFMFSSEFDNYMEGLYGDTSRRAEIYAVVDFYRGILNRLPDDGGYIYWLNRFRAAQCIGSAAVTAEVESISSYFFSSPEYVEKGRSNKQFAQDLYYTFMRRYASDPEVNYWVNELNSGARTREELRQYFIQSPEFQGRVAAMINEGCL